MSSDIPTVDLPSAIMKNRMARLLTIALASVALATGCSATLRYRLYAYARRWNQF